MRKLSVFNQISLDGYFCNPHGDMSWAHKHDAEWGAFVSENATKGGALLFGRVTYELMASYWPSAAARRANPVVAEMMTDVPKFVFSRTLGETRWKNTTLVNGELGARVRKMKEEPGSDMVILGSGSIVSQLTSDRLIDEYTVVVNPVVLGGGRTMFEGIRDEMTLRLAATRAFSNGNVVLWYEVGN